MELKAVEDILARRIGLDPVRVGRSVIERAVRARLAACGLHHLDEYLDRLAGSDDERDELVEEVVIPESWFFRDVQPFACVRDHVAAGWLLDPDRPPLRVLSVPCAGGEEPYSIAMTLLELGLPAARFAIVAVDVSARSLERARRGVYGANAFRGPDLAFRARFFRPHPEGHELDPEVRATVQFARANLLEPDLLSDRPGYDVIFCRNVLIYLADSARAQVLAALDRLLAPSGLLFLGHAESLAVPRRPFTPTTHRGCFAHERAQAGGSIRDGLAADRHAARPSLPRPIRPRPPSPLPELMPVAAPSAEEPAAPARGIAPGPDLLEQAAELANQRLYDQAARLCEQSLAASGPTARAFFLLGMIRQAANDPERAEACFQKTVYLDSQHDEALLALALLAERRGDPAAAAGFHRRAARAARAKATS
jgi:chemotaxis protein methyltransferase WspC